MDLTTVTVQDFKDLFTRDFPYLPEWSATQIYNNDAIVYYSTTLLFYQANQNAVPVGTVPTNGSFWNDYEDDIFNYVLDSDITKAFAEAQINLNQALFGSDAQVELGYLYLTAHYMVMDIRGAQKGIESTGEFAVSGRSVGSVSENYVIPDAYKDSPFLGYLAKTSYGQKYLSLIMPNLVGNVNAVCGATNP